MSKKSTIGDVLIAGLIIGVIVWLAGVIISGIVALFNALTTKK